MIQVNLRKLLQKLENDGGYKISISELSRKTGIHRTILSKLNNDPSQVVSSEVIGSLVDFAFRTLRSGHPDKDLLNPAWKLTDQQLMDSLVTTLVSSFPLDRHILYDIEPHLENSKYTTMREIDGEMKPVVVLMNIPFDKLWEYHEKLHPDHIAYWKKAVEADVEINARFDKLIEMAPNEEMKKEFEDEKNSLTFGMVPFLDDTTPEKLESLIMALSIGKQAEKKAKKSKKAK